MSDPVDDVEGDLPHDDDPDVVAGMQRLRRLRELEQDVRDLDVGRRP